MNYTELEESIVKWAEDKGILEKGTPMGQSLKTLEESLELANAINSQDRDEIVDALGDILVTIIIQAKMQNVSLMECLEGAYNIIAKRKGKMVNGMFIKDNPDQLEFPNLGENID